MLRVCGLMRTRGIYINDSYITKCSTVRLNLRSVCGRSRYEAVMICLGHCMVHLIGVWHHMAEQ